MYPGRLFTLCFVVFSFDFVHWAVFGFLAKTMQDVHGFGVGEVSLVVFCGGTLGVVGNLVAGVVGDRVGRRRVMFALLMIHLASAWSFYNATTSWAVVGAWIGIVFASTGLGVMTKALGGELFPTSYRSTAAGVRLLLASLGGYLGYMAESALYPAALASLGDTPGAEALAHSVAITWMLPVIAIPAVAIFFLPETAGRELEDVSPEIGRAEPPV
jgi:MFS family permease